MKKIFAVLAGTALLLVACEKGGKSGQSQEDQSIAETSTAGNSENYGYILRPSGSLMVYEKGDTNQESDKVKWSANLPLGERVLVYGDRRATYNNAVTSFVEISRVTAPAGVSEGLAFANQIARGGALAVITDQTANLFNTPKPIGVTTTIVPYQNIVVYFPETEEDGFVEIRTHEAAKWMMHRGFIRLSSLSRKDADVQSAILLTTAKLLKDEGDQKIRRDSLLRSAYEGYPSSIFIEEIRALMNPAAQENPAEFVMPAVENYSTALEVLFDRVNVRDLPDTTAGKVVGQVNTGDILFSPRSTVDKFTVNDQTDFWWYVETDSFSGWIFGAFVEENGR